MKLYLRVAVSLLAFTTLVACESAKRAGGEESMEGQAGQDVQEGMRGGSTGMMMGGQEAPQVTPPEDCVSDLDYFKDKVWRPILKPLCLDCHNPQGAAQSTDMVYVSEEQANALETNYAVFADIASFDRDGSPLVLLKPTNLLAHSGGELFAQDSEAYETLTAMIDRTRLSEPVVCDQATLGFDESLFNGVKLLGAQETVRRASLGLAGRLPTSEEIEAIESHGWSGVELALNHILSSEAFYLRLKEIWNDILLTDKYMGRNNAIDLLSVESFPNARWHLNLEEQPRDERYWAAIDYANTSLAREALEHIVYVVRNHKPFHEIITSDYIAMNPFTARIYGVEDIEWDDELDPKEFRPGRAPGVPHAGILSSPMFLNRFPTTATNRNRHRARVFFKLFLDLDVFKLAERPIDPTSTVHNPTMNDPQCSICHTVIDPVAGAFQHWDEQGSFSFRDTWFGDMRAPGFMDEELPFESRTASLRWLTLQVAEDPRFDRSITRLLYKVIIGDDLMSAPREGENFEARELAFNVQQRFVDRVAEGFRANEHDLTWLIKEIIRSPYYRAAGIEENANPSAEQLAQWTHLGLDRPLTPEQLNRKLLATTGAHWRPNHTSQDFLIDNGQYKLLYGGIDSDDVVDRIRTPNGIFSNIQRRMSNEVSCKVTAYDFTKPAEERFLFPWAEVSYEPVDINGFPIPQVEERLRSNLVYLSWTMWGERYEVDSPEIDELFNLWIDLWTLGLEEIESETTSSRLSWGCRGSWDLTTGQDLPQERQVTEDPRFVVRAWSAMLSIFLNDPAFLYE